MSTNTEMSTSTDTTATSVIITPKVAQCVDAFYATSKKTVTAYLIQAETVVNARATLTAEEYKVFLRQVNLSESNAKKFCCIAKHKALFAEHADTLPTNWTTLYKISQQDAEAISEALRNNHITIDLTAKSLTQIASFKCSNENKRAHRKFSDIGKAETSEVADASSANVVEYYKVDFTQIADAQDRCALFMSLLALREQFAKYADAFVYSDTLLKSIVKEQSTKLFKNAA